MVIHSVTPAVEYDSIEESQVTWNRSTEVRFICDSLCDRTWREKNQMEEDIRLVSLFMQEYQKIDLQVGLPLSHPCS